jgi:hypothetical protein
MFGRALAEAAGTDAVDAGKGEDRAEGEDGRPRTRSEWTEWARVGAGAGALEKR